MTCPNCGGIIDDYARSCEFCGSPISAQVIRESEQARKKGCPSCGSTNITYRRENHGEIRGKKQKQNVYRTVGFCQDCGHTFLPSNQPMQEQKKNNKIWWVLGWIFFFPAPVMVLIWRKKCTWNVKVKIGVTVAFWILFFVLCSSGSTDSSSSSTKEVSVSEPVVAIEESSENDNTPVVENIEVTTQEETNPEEANANDEPDMTMGQKQAIKSAENYLSFTAFSKKGLIKQLSSEYGDGFDEEDATFAVEYLEQNGMVDWKEQAVKSAENYLSFTSFSRDGLIEQLTSDVGDQYTVEEAEYAVNAVGY